MKPRFRLRSLFALMTALAVEIALVRGVMYEPEPLWGLYLIALTSVCSAIAAIVIGMFDAQRGNE